MSVAYIGFYVFLEFSYNKIEVVVIFSRGDKAMRENILDGNK